MKKENLLITDRIIDTVCKRLSNNQQIRRTLPENGRVHIDRQLPFLIIYRYLKNKKDIETHRFAMNEASYIVCSGQPAHQQHCQHRWRCVLRLTAKLHHRGKHGIESGRRYILELRLRKYHLL